MRENHASLCGLFFLLMDGVARACFVLCCCVASLFKFSMLALLEALANQGLARMVARALATKIELVLLLRHRLETSVVKKNSCASIVCCKMYEYVSLLTYSSLFSYRVSARASQTCDL